MTKKIDDYPHRLSFSCDVEPIKIDWEDSSASIGGLSVTKAAVEDLSELFPDIDYEKHIDLLAVAFEGNEVNRFNKNGHGIATESALEIAEMFSHKPINMDHQKSEIVGHLATSAFKKGTEILTADQVSNMNEPFKMCFGGVIYKVAHEGFAQYLESLQDYDYYENH